VFYANVYSAMIGTKVIMILIVLETREREEDGENEKKYTVVMMHTLHVFMCLFVFFLFAILLRLYLMMC
jgi:1,4-dihydroxy-2-naphthoate octaprenyltransferase